MYYLFEIEDETGFILLQESKNYTYLKDMKQRLEKVFTDEKYIILKDVIWKVVKLK